MKHSTSFFDLVYKTIKKIPAGKVATYGQIAQIIGTRDARRVGHALHANRDINVPCHRVVNKDGRLAPNFAFDGAREQRKRLLGEGVEFIDEMHVNLKKHLWQMK
jgi:methylated-DNA-protein-cysteine methyltransferase-like protein